VSEARTLTPPAETVTVGGDAETTTTSKQERQQREIEVPSWTAAEFVYDGSHWLWLINSANILPAYGVTAIRWTDGASGR
jgi:hypothetical protein